MAPMAKPKTRPIGRPTMPKAQRKALRAGIEWIKARKCSGLHTLTAETIGVTPRTLSRLLYNDGGASRATVERVAAVRGVSVEALLSGES